MNSTELIESFQEFKDFKNINKATLMNILESVFRATIKKQYGDDENFDFIVNVDKGDLEIWRNRGIVKDGEVEDDNTQISLSNAQKIETDFEVGEEISEEIKIEDFGRRSVLTLRQNLKSKILELEKDNIYKLYKDRIGDLITGEVYQVWKKEMLVIDDSGNELILPKSEQIPNDRFKKGDTIRAVVLKVDLKNNKPTIIISRTSPLLLERLFELEVPEIYDGLITIKKVVREPGERAKISVESYDDRVDPVGACVGIKGSRIHGIVRELRNESIDVINHTDNLELFIQRALGPAKTSSIKLDHEKRLAEVYLKTDQVSLAIGKSGYNIRLAGKLVNYEIDVYRDSIDTSEDVALEEFTDEIEEWVIEELKKIGCDSAKSVLELSPEELVKRTDLEIETVEDVLSILKKEFEI